MHFSSPWIEAKTKVLGAQRCCLWICVLLLSIASVGPINASLAQQSTPELSSEAEQMNVRFGLLPSGENAGSYFNIAGLNPGESITLEALLVNVGNVSVRLRAYSTNAYSGVNGGFLAGDAGEEPRGSAAWVDFPAFELELAPGTETIVPFTVTVPEQTDPGQYISALIVETVDSFEIPGSEMFDQRIRFATTVVVLVPGELYHSFELSNPVWDRGYLAVPVQNTGNFLVKPEGEVVMRNSAGATILTAPIKMGSVYATLGTGLYVDLPDQLPSGEYRIDLTLTDPESGAVAKLENVLFTVPEPEDPTGLFLRDHDVVPNSQDIVFATVTLTVENGGAQLPAADVLLEVSHDGTVVEEYPLARNQVLVRGENTLSTRYIPSENWQTGNYTFRVKVFSVDPNSDKQVELLNQPLDVELIVP